VKSDLESFNDMVDRVFLELWRRKTRGDVLKEEYFKNFPIKRFNIAEISESISKRGCLSEESFDRASAILADLKVLLYFLGSVEDYFYVGMAEIVGNSGYQKVGLNTLSMLQGNHYRVYLITITYERILDLLELVSCNKLSDPKTNKWGKKHEKLRGVAGFDLVTEAEHKKMIGFRDRVRRAEIHGFSSVIRQLDADKWDHFQEEEELVRGLLLRIADKCRQ
jgi:hypothetical protein